MRKVLGEHVEQSGSFVNADRLRFDFTHFSAMTADEIKEVESLVNGKIAEFIPVKTDIMSIDEAKKTGAMALFGEKYGAEVRVVTMGDFSKELCGGTHVSNTGNIGMFKIISEGSVASGVRRIEAITGHSVLDYYAAAEARLNSAAAKAKTDPENLEKKIEDMLAQIKELNSEIASLKSKEAKEALGSINIEEINGIKLIAQVLEGVDAGQMRELGDELKARIGEGVVALASCTDGKVSLMVTATDGAVKSGVHSGNIIKAIAPIVGGRGGGRPNMAQAGGSDASGMEAALAKVRELL